MAAPRKVGTYFVKQLRREGTGTNPRGVCLGDSQNVIEIQRTESTARGSVNALFGPFPITGQDLIEAGIVPGPKMGEQLNQLKTI